MVRSGEIGVSSRTILERAGGRVDIEDLLRGLGLERYAAAFRSSDIGVDVLPDLTDADLRELGV